MKFNIFSESCIGYKNKKVGKTSQDYGEYKVYEDSIIAVVSDGHSDDYFVYSDLGAKFACMAFIDVMKTYKDIDINVIEKELENYNVQNEITKKWREYVNFHYYNNNARAYRLDYYKYATTMSGVLVRKNDIISIKIGDSQIVYKNNNKTLYPIKTKEKKYVDSIAKENSYLDMMYKIDDINKLKYIILFTDGYENCFKNKTEIIKDLEQTVTKYQKNIFTKTKLLKDYKKYLNKLSTNDSKDDIHIIFLMNKI